MVDPGDVGVGAAAAQRDRALQALTAYATAQHELGRHFARIERMHTTDAQAIVEVLSAEDRGAPLTPARLAERIGLSTGATSTLLNRLEETGHVVRTRGHRDRRMVTLHSTAAIHERADAFYAPLSEQLHTVLAGCGAAELDRFAALADRLRAVVEAHVLGEQAGASGDPAPRHGEQD